VDALGLFLSLIALALIGGVLYVIPGNHSVVLEERLRRILVAIVSGLVGYVLLGTGLIQVERVAPIAKAVQSWLPYQTLPVVVSLLFAGVGLLLLGRRNGQ
jgi:uncharacterized membrane protein YdcZ (DUF606 family)